MKDGKQKGHLFTVFLVDVPVRMYEIATKPRRQSLVASGTCQLIDRWVEGITGLIESDTYRVRT